MLGVCSLQFSHHTTCLHSGFILAAFFFPRVIPFDLLFFFYWQMPEWSSTLLKGKMLVISNLTVKLMKHKEYKTS